MNTQVKHRPILFSGDMVRAILEGRKTQTRRVIGLEKVNENPAEFDYAGEMAANTRAQLEHTFAGESYNVFTKCPYGKPGDVLWVRESFRQYKYIDELGEFTDQTITEYKADNPEDVCMVDGDGFQMWNKDGSEKYVPFKPSIHMPKAACRLFLKIKSVRVERLQDISEADAVAEGVEKNNPKSNPFYKDYSRPETNDFVYAVNSFRTLWFKINGGASWDANPWVWVVEFERIDKPENF
jgi:hypothetical protein